MLEVPLARRLAKHVSDYKSYLNGKKNFISSYDIIKNGDYDIILIEKFPCNSKDELYSRESYWTKQNKCVNIVKNQGLKLQLGINEYGKQYNKLNKEKQYENKLKNKIYNVCECGGKYTNCHKNNHLNTNKHKTYANKKYLNDDD